MESRFKTLVNLKALIHETLKDIEHDAKESDNFLDVETLIALYDAITMDLKTSRNKLLDKSLSLIDKQGITMKAAESQARVKERLVRYL